MESKLNSHKDARGGGGIQSLAITDRKPVAALFSAKVHEKSSLATKAASNLEIEKPMKTRGRRSSAQTAIEAISKVSAHQRPDAPYDLTDEQVDEWRAVVNRMPADWFPRETHGMLSQYCRHIVSARRIAQLIERAMKSKKAFDVDAYNQLLIMQEREGRALSSLATRMRISQQAAYDKTKKKASSTIQGKLPWDPDF
jgi:hypothetical protein